MRYPAAGLLCWGFVLSVTVESCAPGVAIAAHLSPMTNTASLAEPETEQPVSQTAADLLEPRQDAHNGQNHKQGPRALEQGDRLQILNDTSVEPDQDAIELKVRELQANSFEPVPLTRVPLAASSPDPAAFEKTSEPSLDQPWLSSEAIGQTVTPAEAPTPANLPASGQAIDLDPEIIENSPVLQRWLHEVPDVLSEIRHDPSFRTRLRLGYSQFPANEQAAGFNVGIEDVFLGRTGLTASASYQRAFSRQQEAYGADLRYYVLPLGGYINAAPVIGYRHIDTDRYTVDGLNVGFRILLVPSRTGAADISFTQSWVAPGTNEEVGISTLSFGYALTHNLRLSTDLQKQNAPERKDSRVAIVLEWMLR
jgi:hypothetical protein